MNATTQGMMNDSFDISTEFQAIENTIYLSEDTVKFDSETGEGMLGWKRHIRKPRMAFSQVIAPLEVSPSWEFPPKEYEQDPVLPFEVHPVGPGTFRIRIQTNKKSRANQPSEMLVNEPCVSTEWSQRKTAEGHYVWEGSRGSLILHTHPWRLEFRDASDKLLTQTVHPCDGMSLQNINPLPFSIIRSAHSLERQFAATFSLAPEEKIYGCGESFTRLDKRGQKITLWTKDAHGVQTQDMYKPIPFFMSNRGYGMFVHSSTPMTFDFGHDFDGATTLHVGDEVLDLFVFLGSPKEILNEYTALTGRSPMPPLWSFGLWMSRITYKSEEETREVADTLRELKIPCDVIHLDTGWFETDWRCDYKFSESRFADPEKMIKDLQKQGFRVCLWQLPYFTPANPVYAKAIEEGYVVRGLHGNEIGEDAVLDFSNPEAVVWYKQLLAGLLKIGVAAIKADFGEAGPLQGLYASGKTGWHEHNLYPLRYNKAVSEITKDIHDEHVIWARSAWAGSQRYPLHWGGDAENTDCGMAASLRGGLSLGLCGFSFWSHDIGGFVNKSPEALYRRWLPFGMLTSHSRCHGAPPKEPWPYGTAFTDKFRRAVELKYRIMPYVYTQAQLSSSQGWPMLRPLWFEYPDDPGAWGIEDEYLFGQDMLVAPLMEEVLERNVYLPSGHWIDYQSGCVYSGGRYVRIKAGEIPCIILIREGAVIPQVPIAQHTAEIAWDQLELTVYAPHSRAVESTLYLPGMAVPLPLKFEADGNGFRWIDKPPSLATSTIHVPATHPECPIV